MHAASHLRHLKRMQANPWKGHFVGLLHSLENAMFYVDIQLNLRTAVYDSNAELVTERKNIVRRYARRWLAVDLLSVLPLDGLLQSAAGLVGLLKGGHWCRATSAHRLLDCWVLDSMDDQSSELSRLNLGMDAAPKMPKYFALAGFVMSA